mgnify:CR=1 FL=1
MKSVKSFSQFITEAVEGVTPAAPASPDSWSIFLGWMMQFDSQIKADTLEAANAAGAKLDPIDVMGAVKELRIFGENKRDGLPARPLSPIAQRIFNTIQPQVAKIDAESRAAYLKSGKSGTTNLYN